MMNDFLIVILYFIAFSCTVSSLKQVKKFQFWWRLLTFSNKTKLNKEPWILYKLLNNFESSKFCINKKNIYVRQLKGSKFEKRCWNCMAATGRKEHSFQREQKNGKHHLKYYFVGQNCTKNSSTCTVACWAKHA